jgi:hypothetical protein
VAPGPNNQPDTQQAEGEVHDSDDKEELPSAIAKAKSTVDSALNATPALRHARKVIVAVVGGTVFLLWVILLVTPGPAFVVIPAGLGILAIEFGWARRWLRKLKAMIPNGNDSNGKLSDTKSD